MPRLEGRQLEVQIGSSGCIHYYPQNLETL